MPADTFGTAWRQVWLHVPSASALLAQQWTRSAFRKTVKSRAEWSWLRREIEYTVPDLIAGTADVVEGSPSVQALTLAASPSLINRQFRGATFPVYTITAVAGTTLTLDRPWAGVTTPAAAVRVYQCYLTMPPDFGRWVGLRDVLTRRPVKIFMTETEVNRWDVARELTGADPRVLASYRPDAAGRIRYELWPHPTARRTFTGLYFASDVTLVDSTPLPGVLTDDKELLIKGALAEAAMWPGVEGRRNPYFNLALAQMLRKDFDEALHTAEISDEDLYLTWYQDYMPETGSFTPHPAYDDSW